MSSGSDRDVTDFVEDTSQHEDETLFFPVPEGGGPDHWSAFYLGILVGIVGGGFVSLAPWLAGVLILTGYGLTAFTLRNPGNRFTRALLLGFVVSAGLGAALLAGEIFIPKTAWKLIEILSQRNVIFASVAVMPWLLGIFRYVYALAVNEKRLSVPGRRA